jgi:hypothetical protein
MELKWSKLVPLNQSSIEQIETKPGIFRLAYKAADGAHYVFYVGSTSKSIKEELSNVISGTLNNPCVKIHLENLECFFRYAFIENTEDLNDILKTIYEHFKPKCNLEIPGGKIVTINFN